MLKRPVLVIIMGCLPTWRTVCAVMFLCENVLQRQSRMARAGRESSSTNKIINMPRAALLLLLLCNISNCRGNPGSRLVVSRKKTLVFNNNIHAYKYMFYSTFLKELYGTRSAFNPSSEEEKKNQTNPIIVWSRKISPELWFHMGPCFPFFFFLIVQ